MATLVLSEQLSAAYVAFTIEADTLAEEWISHRTADHGEVVIDGRQTVWLASLAMYFTCLRWLPEDGLRIEQLRERARTATNLDGMRRWGYVTVDGSGKRPASGRYPMDATIAPSRRGRAATRVYREVIAETERRWRERFEPEVVDRLRDALLAITTEIDLALPDCMPILGFGLHSLRRDGPSLEDWPRRAETEREADRELPLVSLLARVLFWITLVYELEATIALAVMADVIVPIGTGAVPLRELPARAGVFRPGIDMAITYLTERRCVVLEPVPGKARGKQVRLTTRGLTALKAGPARLERVHAQLGQRFGASAASGLTDVLEPIVGDATRDGSPLFAGLQPPAGTWRAETKGLPRLPRFPHVLHRGGFPDGA